MTEFNDASPCPHFADRWHAAAREKGAPVCVGLDPVLDKLPAALRDRCGEEPTQCAAALETFCVHVLDAVADHVPCVKVQAACFERYHGAGFDAMFRVIEAARRRGLIVIADAKRGDIGTSARHYAATFLQGPSPADALTVNAYLGADALEPFVEHAARQGQGLFALVRTSNPGGDALQGQALQDGRTVADAVADMITELGAREPGYLSSGGYSMLGAVVGATKSDEAHHLRRRMPGQLFLVPGFGAQGGGAEDVKPCFHADGSGAIVTASRSVIYAFDDEARDWPAAIGDAARMLNEQIAALF